MATTITHSYRFLGFTCHVLDDRTIAQVSTDGTVIRVTADRRDVIAFYSDLDQALLDAATPAGPGHFGRPCAAWQS